LWTAEKELDVLEQIQGNDLMRQENIIGSGTYYEGEMLRGRGALVYICHRFLQLNLFVGAIQVKGLSTIFPITK
jgi:hypothetical protein